MMRRAFLVLKNEVRIKRPEREESAGRKERIKGARGARGETRGNATCRRNIWRKALEGRLVGPSVNVCCKSKGFLGAAELV